MASVHRKLATKYWEAHFYDEAGVRRARSTKCTNRKEAQSFADDLEAAHKKKATEGQMRRILSGLNERLAGQPLASATLKDFAAQWLTRKQGEIENVSFLAYKGAVNGFVVASPSKANMGIQYVTPADIATYRDKCAAKATPKTANNKLKILRTFFQTAWRDGYIQENPAAKVDALRADETNRRPFTLPEIKKVLLIANMEWRGMTLFGLYTGQRLKDIALLRWDNFEATERVLRLKTSKTKRHQEIPLAQPLLDYLAEIPALDDARASVFPNASALVNKDGDVGRLSQQFFEILSTAKLVKERLAKDEAKGVGRTGKRERNDLSFHCLRHTATSLLKNAGVSESVAQDIVGHDSAEMSRHYSHIDLSAKRTAIAKMPDITSK